MIKGRKTDDPKEGSDKNTNKKPNNNIDIADHQSVSQKYFADKLKRNGGVHARNYTFRNGLLR